MAATTVKAAKAAPADKKPEILIIELVDRQASNFTLEGSEEQGAPVSLDGPAARKVLAHSHMVTDEGDFIPIRYIKGCSTILVSEQEKAKFKPNPLNDLLWITGCREIVVNREPDRAKFAYLKACLYNQDAPNRPEGYKPIFKEIKQQEIAKKDMAKMYLEADAIAAVRSLSTPKKGGGYDYDMPKINFLATLFEITGLESTDEILYSLVMSAKADPELFLNTIASKTKEVKVEILHGKQNSVISFEGDKASIVATGHAFLNFSSDDENEKIDELIRYFLSPGGELDYKQFLILLQHAKEQMLS